MIKLRNKLNRKCNQTNTELGNIYSKMCSEGYAHNFSNNMKLLRLTLLIRPSTAGVQRGFPVINLLVLPLRKSLNENNIDWLTYLSGWTKISQWRTTRNNHRNIQRQCSRRISLECFLLWCSMTYLEVFIDFLLIYIDYLGLKYNCVLSLSVIECKYIIME